MTYICPTESLPPYQLGQSAVAHFSLNMYIMGTKIILINSKITRSKISLDLRLDLSLDLSPDSSLDISPDLSRIQIRGFKIFKLDLNPT